MNGSELYRLMSWLSPAFPVGAFSHSSGLEWAVEEALVTDRESLVAWLGDILQSGSAKSEAVLFTHAYGASADGDLARLLSVAELAAALNPSRERRLETTAQGAAFRRIALSSASCAALEPLAAIPDDELCYPIVVAVLAQGHGIPVEAALTAYLHAVVGNLVSAAQRLVPLGQTDGQIAIASLEPDVLRLAGWAIGHMRGDPFDHFGSASLMADFASLAHETQYTRLFRT